MKKFILIFAVALGMAGCTADDQATYSDDKAFIAFKSNVYDLKVPINASNSVDLVLQASNKVSTDRTYSVELITSETDANPATYSFPATFTIPANSYTGNLTVTGTDNSLVDANIKKLTLKVSGYGVNESFDSDRVVVNIVEFCAVDLATFSGDFISSTWWAAPSVNNVNEVIAGDTPNSLKIVNFFSDNAVAPDFILTYDPNDNNKVTFADTYTGASITQGQIWARMSVAPNTSSVDACTGKINLWIKYYIKGTTLEYSDKNEIFTKL